MPRRKKMNIIVISLLGILATLVIYILISNDNNSNNEIANSSITTNIIEDDKNTDQNTDNKKDNQNLNDTILQVKPFLVLIVPLILPACIFFAVSKQNGMIFVSILFANFNC